MPMTALWPTVINQARNFWNFSLENWMRKLKNNMKTYQRLDKVAQKHSAVFSYVRSPICANLKFYPFSSNFIKIHAVVSKAVWKVFLENLLRIYFESKYKKNRKKTNSFSKIPKIRQRKNLCPKFSRGNFHARFGVENRKK